MKISQTGPSAPARSSRKAGHASESNGGDLFKTHIQDESASTASTANTAASLTALGNLLAIQEISNGRSDRQHSLSKGGALLDELTQLQVGLVQGWVPEDTLRRLSHLLNQPRPKLDDSSLNQLLDEIEVRAAVELAKLENDDSQDR